MSGCRHCNGTGADWWLVTDDYTGPFGNREQVYSASACEACAGTGSDDPAVIAAKLSQPPRTVAERGAAFEARMAEWRDSVTLPASTRVAFVERASGWDCVPRVGAMPWRVTA